MKKEFKSKLRKYFVDWLPDSVFNSFSKEERSLYSKYRYHHLQYHNHLKEIDDVKEKLENYKRKVEERISELNNLVKESEKEFLKSYNVVKHLNQEIEFTSWTEKEWRNKKECEEVEGTKEQHRIRYMISYNFSGERLKKGLSCGSNQQKSKEILERYINLTDKPSSLDDLRFEIQKICDSFCRYQIYKNTYKGFHNTPWNFEQAVEWCNEYDTKHGKGKYSEWWYGKTPHHFSI